MPHSDLHKKKLKNNLAVLALIAAFCAIVFGITVIKISDPPPASEITDSAAETPPS